MSSCAQDNSDIGLQGVVLPAGKEQAGLVRWIVVKDLCCGLSGVVLRRPLHTVASAAASLTADVRHAVSSEQSIQGGGYGEIGSSL